MQKPIPVRTGISTPKQDKFFEIRETKQQLRRDSRVGGHTPDVANENKYVRSREHTSEQLMQVQEKTSITLSTLDVQLADNLLGDFSFDGNLVGEYFDKFIQSESRKETKLSLKVFEYQGKLYSEELVRLWFYNQNTGFQRTFHYQEKFFQDMSILFLLSVVIL